MIPNIPSNPSHSLIPCSDLFCRLLEWCWREGQQLSLSSKRTAAFSTHYSWSQKQLHLKKFITQPHNLFFFLCGRVFTMHLKALMEAIWRKTDGQGHLNFKSQTSNFPKRECFLFQLTGFSVVGTKFPIRIPFNGVIKHTLNGNVWTKSETLKSYILKEKKEKKGLLSQCGFHCLLICSQTFLLLQEHS